jgi:Uma2 family endonuclease
MHEREAMKLIDRGTHHHTYGEYLTWFDNQLDELIDGIAYVKESPAPSTSHQDVVVELTRQIATALIGKPYRLYVAPFDVRLPKLSEADDEIDTVLQPDLLVTCDPGKIDQRGMRGAPDWLAEVLSPSTARHDRTIKIPVYERVGVREVWLIHPIDRTLSMYQLKAGRYGRPTILDLKGKTKLAAVPGVAVNWDLVVSRILE